METPIGDDEDSPPGASLEDDGAESPIDIATIEGFNVNLSQTVALQVLTLAKSKVLLCRFGYWHE